MNTKTVLLVEDESIIALAESMMVKGFGYNTVTATNGEEAVDISTKTASIDLILMDIDLGKGIDGTEAAKRILSVRNVPIVFLTSHAEQEMVNKVHGITCYGYVLKNSGSFVLRSSIEMAFELYASLQETLEKERELLREQSLMRALMENIPDYIYFKDCESRFIRASTAIASSFGIKDPKVLEGKTDFDFFTEEHARQAYEDEQEIIRTGMMIAKEEKETRTGRPDAWVSTKKLPLIDEKGKIIGTFGISRDITELKRSENKIEFHSRLYATLSQINRIIIRAKNQMELFESICRIVIQTGQFRMAWIGQVDEANNKVVQITKHSQEIMYLEDRGEVISSVPFKNSPLGSAILNKKVVLFEDPADIGRQKDQKGDLLSAAIIPIDNDDLFIGILGIYATKNGFFTLEEYGLLEEIGMDISFALKNISKADIYNER